MASAKDLPINVIHLPTISKAQLKSFDMSKLVKLIFDYINNSFEEVFFEKILTIHIVIGMFIELILKIVTFNPLPTYSSHSIQHKR